MAAKYYAVKKGRKPGVYFTWDDCRENVIGCPGAVYKSFPTLQEAQEFAGMKAAEPDKAMVCGTGAADRDCYAFVDGSYNTATKVYGYGGFLVNGSQKYTLRGKGNDPELASMRNVAGEVAGSMAAIAKAVELGLPRVTIYYDYMGIEMWATGAWKRNKKGTAAYYDYVQSVKDRIQISFCKVKGHSGVEGNEEADRLAKEAVGNL